MAQIQDIKVGIQADVAGFAAAARQVTDALRGGPAPVPACWHERWLYLWRERHYADAKLRQARWDYNQRQDSDEHRHDVAYWHGYRHALDCATEHYAQLPRNAAVLTPIGLAAGYLLGASHLVQWLVGLAL